MAIELPTAWSIANVLYIKPPTIAQELHVERGGDGVTGEWDGEPGLPVPSCLWPAVPVLGENGCLLVHCAGARLLDAIAIFESREVAGNEHDGEKYTANCNSCHGSSVERSFAIAAHRSLRHGLGHRV